MTLKLHCFTTLPLLSMSLEINLILSVWYEMINDKANLWTLGVRGDAQWYRTWRKKHFYFGITKETIFSLNINKKVTSKGANYSNTFCHKSMWQNAKHRGRTQNYRVREQRVLQWERSKTESYRATYRPNMWHLVTHELMGGLLKNTLKGQRPITSSEPEKYNKKFTIIFT